MITMHYRTFDLCDEPIAEPLERMQKIAADHPGEVTFLETGEVLPL